MNPGSRVFQGGLILPIIVKWRMLQAVSHGSCRSVISPRAIQVTIRNNETVLIADAANKEEIDARVAQIKKELAETDSVYDTEKLSERVAKLAGGVAVIKVS